MRGATTRMTSDIIALRLQPIPPRDQTVDLAVQVRELTIQSIELLLRLPAYLSSASDIAGYPFTRNGSSGVRRGPANTRARICSTVSRRVRRSNDSRCWRSKSAGVSLPSRVLS
jgi:hypothetical protein